MKGKQRTRWLYAILLLLSMWMMPTGIVQAADYEVTVVNEAITGTYKGKALTDTYAAMIKKEDQYQVVKPCTKNSSIYYFDKDGYGTPYTKSGMLKITYNGKKKQYYAKKGALASNEIAGNSKEGYYYVGSDGIVVKDKVMKRAVKFVRAHTKANWSQSKKLKACYQYLWKHYTYQRFYESPKASKMSSFANYMLSKKKGNCYRYAASFAYIARALGYDVRVAAGSIPHLHGNGMTPHGWTEIKIDGSWYLFDANMQRNFPGVDSYMKTEKTYPYAHKVYARYKMKVSNGKISWKK